MTQTITANEFKTKGVTIVNDETADGTEVIIPVRGKTSMSFCLSKNIII